MGVRLARFVLDTNAVLYLLGGPLAQPLPAGGYFISVISELELLAYPNITEDKEEHIKALLEDVRPAGSLRLGSFISALNRKV